MTDQEGLLAAILRDPDEDTPRLMYADEVQHAEPDRAEFIRVQCELHRIRQSTLKAQRRGTEWRTASRGYAACARHESALLAAHPDWFRVECPACIDHDGMNPCPGCGGRGPIYRDGHGIESCRECGSIESSICDTCSGIGHIPGTPRRGFAYSCAATMGQCFEQWNNGGDNHRFVSRLRFVWSDPDQRGTNQRLDAYRNDGSVVAPGDWFPTEWLLCLLRIYPTLEEVRVSDAVPWDAVGVSGWAMHSEEVHQPPHRIPEILYDALTGWSDIDDGWKWYSTHDAAHTALARAVVAVAKKYIQE